MSPPQLPPKLLSRITIDPEVCHGKPVIRGMRYPFSSILEYLSSTPLMMCWQFNDCALRACIEFGLIRSWQLVAA
jgi:hypothetical protein